MANKWIHGNKFSRQLGKPCPYCKRVMCIDIIGLIPTRDHVHPKSHGGRRTIWACDDCNHIKGNMLPEQWEAFMKANPHWWWRRRRNAKFWQAVAKAHGEPIQASEPLTSVPHEYDDPKAQAAFEAVYKNRLHMLR